MTPVQRILVFGGGGHGKVVADAAMAAGMLLGGFLEDDPGKDGTRVMDAPVISWARFLADRAAWSDAAVALGIGDNAGRERVWEKLIAAGCAVATVVHPRSVISPSAVLGQGTVVFAGAVVNPEARVGAGAILNTGCVVEHDVVLGDFVHLSPNVALGGGVRIGPRTHVGLGAVVLPLVEIGADVRVGAGAAVICPVPSGVTVVGVPARALPARPR
jgi:sugar O-acyltransferase (sialic acid O-acetyltransferase NeuD family)